MDKEKIGHLISTLRKEKFMTQKDLADKLHVSDRTVSKWERGAGLPDPSSMVALSDLLGITVNELLQGERSPDIYPAAQSSEDAKQAFSILCQHMRAQERKLRGRIIASIVLIALLIIGTVFVLKHVAKDRILSPPPIRCELLQRDIDFEADLTVARNDTGVYNYICTYSLDQYGDVRLKDRAAWQSYTDIIPARTYKELKELCPGEITSIDITDTGYLVCAWQDLTTAVLTETDSSLTVIFRYTFDTQESLSTAFITGDTLYIVYFNNDENRTYVMSVNKITGLEQTDSFSYQDFSEEIGSKDSMGGFLFDRANMWVRDDILYFAETYYEGPPSFVLGAYDLEKNKAIAFKKTEHAQVVMTHKQPDKGEVSVLVNPMGYRPLELYTIDDTTLEIKSTVQLELPNEYLTRQNSEYAADTYMLFTGDMNENFVAVRFGDSISRDAREDETTSCILAVYDRTSGDPVWRGRITMSEKYEIDTISISHSEE